MIIWIASYPKSGNTWVRSFLSSYIYPNEEINIFENIQRIKKFPNKSQFKGIFEINPLEREKRFAVCSHWITAQEKINLKNEVTLLKTHNMGGTVNGNDFTNSKNTLGVIYLIRDPRSVAVSNAYHNNISFDQSINDLLDENISATNDGYLFEFRSSWKVNYLSWKNKSFSKIIVKYEDLHQDAFKNFKKILNFVNTFKRIDIIDEKIKNTQKMCQFSNLSKLEQSEGFIEKLKSEKFFRKGIIDEWKSQLNNKQIKKIEDAFFNEMKELNYI